MIDILGLLKRIETEGFMQGYSCCPECNEEAYGFTKDIKLSMVDHKPDCQLKAAIDALEAGKLLVMSMPWGAKV